jgi:hypothetical protein
MTNGRKQRVRSNYKKNMNTCTLTTQKNRVEGNRDKSIEEGVCLDLQSVWIPIRIVASSAMTFSHPISEVRVYVVPSWSLIILFIIIFLFYFMGFRAFDSISWRLVLDGVG